MQYRDFKIFFLASIVLHIIVILACLLKISPKFNNKYQDVRIVNLDLVSIGKLNLPQKSQQEVAPLDTKETKPETQHTPIAKQSPEPIPTPELVPTPEPVTETAHVKPSVKEPLKESLVQPTKPVAPIATKVMKPQAKTQKKVVKSTEATDLDSLLKTLEKSVKQSNTNTAKNTNPKNTNNQNTSSDAFDDTLPLSITEKELIATQIENHWNLPMGAENIHLSRILVYISLNIDGSVTEVKILNKECNGVSDASCNTVAESCIRAVWQASPLKHLPQDRYDTWKNFKFLFDPSSIAR